MASLSILKTVLGGLFGKRATIPYPVKQKPLFEAARGHIEIDIDKCIFCGICGKKCPTGTINVNRGEKTWSIEQCDCIQCGCCVEVCPKKCLIMDKVRPDAVSVKTVQTFKLRENTDNA